MGTTIAQPVIDIMLLISFFGMLNVVISGVMGIILFFSGNKEAYTRQVQWIVMIFIVSVALFLVAHSNQLLALPTP